MHYGTVNDALEALWAGVDPYSVSSVLCDASESNPALEAVFAEAAAMSGPDAATRLMGVVAATLATRAARDRGVSLNALDALIRAGGDPTAVLPDVAAALPSRGTTQGAAGVLRRAALKGWSLAAVHDSIKAYKGNTSREGVARVRRLAMLQERGELLAVQCLARIYDAQPVSNLFGGIGVLEEQLLSPEGAEAARDTLVALDHAGSSPSRCWFALLPSLEHQLGSGRPEVQHEAARALAQVQYAIGQPDGRMPTEKDGAAFATRSAPVLKALGGALSSKKVRVATSSAEAIRALVVCGASLEGVRSKVEAALQDGRVGVRSECSRALSAWLMRTGEEAPLPMRCSHRRVHAAGDQPLDDEGAERCLVCGEVALVLYRHEDIGQFHADILVEARCSSCGIYSEHRSGY